MLALGIDWAWVAGVLAFWAFGPIMFIGLVYWAGLKLEQRDERRATPADVIEIGRSRSRREHAARSRNRRGVA